MSSIWTDDRVQAAKTLYNGGASASECAATLSKDFGISVTRNSIVGLWWRQKFRGRKTEPPKSRVGTPRRASALAKRVRKPKPVQIVEELFVARTATVQSLGVGLLDLQHGQCRYPYGDGPYVFCGCRTQPDAPYCEPHQRLCTGVRAGANRAGVELRKRAHARNAKGLS